MMLWRTVFCGRPADFQTWLQNKAVSRNGLTSSDQPGLGLFVDKLGLITGRLFLASCSTIPSKSVIQLSIIFRWFVSLQWTFLQHFTHSAISKLRSLSSRLCLKASLSSLSAFLQLGFDILGISSFFKVFLLLALRTQKTGQWSEALPGERMSPASNISSDNSSSDPVLLCNYFPEFPGGE